MASYASPRKMRSICPGSREIVPRATPDSRFAPSGVTYVCVCVSFRPSNTNLLAGPRPRGFAYLLGHQLGRIPARGPGQATASHPRFLEDKLLRADAPVVLLPSSA